MFETSAPFYASFSFVADLFDGVVNDVLEKLDGEERWFSFLWEWESVLSYFH
jgi:hypothetical protein